MKRIAALFLCLLLGLSAQPKEAVDLRTITVQGEEYRLGVSTPQDFMDNGWTCEIGEDGVYAFYSPENESWFYVRTAHGDFLEPMTEIDLLWADGIPWSYCGFSEETPGTEDDISLWSWLVSGYGAEENEEGTLVARAPLSTGEIVQIATKGERVCLTLQE